MAKKKQPPKELPPCTEEEIEAAKEKILDARLKSCRPGLQGAPWLSEAIMSMTLICDEKGLKDMPTMGVDKYWRCYYHPRFVLDNPLEIIAGVLVHEVNHLIRSHWKRALPVHTVWNMATDLEINDDMCTGNKLQLPEDGLFPQKMKLPSELVGEEYYDLIFEKNVEYQESSFGGSCSDGERREWEGPPDNNSIGEEEGKIIIRRTAEAVCKQAGNAPAGLERWAKTVLESKVDWTQQIRNIISHSLNYLRGQMFTSYKYIRRRDYGGFIMPGYVNPVPTVRVIVDTSGSMSEKQLQMALAEIQGLLRTIPNNRISVISGDTETGNAQHSIKNVKDVKLVGGGGTDMGHLIKEHYKDVDLLIVLTDGYTPWCEPVKTRTVAVVFSEEPVPSWINTIRVPAE